MVGHIGAEDYVDDDAAAFGPLLARQVDEYIELVSHQNLHARAVDIMRCGDSVENLLVELNRKGYGLIPRKVQHSACSPVDSCRYGPERGGAWT